MRRLLSAAALVAFGTFGQAAPAQAICAIDVLCAVSECTGTVNVCASDECSGFVSVCPFADPEDCASTVDVCPGITITPTICIPCIIGPDDGAAW